MWFDSAISLSLRLSTRSAVINWETMSISWYSKVRITMHLYFLLKLCKFRERSLRSQNLTNIWTSMLFSLSIRRLTITPFLSFARSQSWRNLMWSFWPVELGNILIISWKKQEWKQVMTLSLLYSRKNKNRWTISSEIIERC